jgi:hypothetical protein
VPHLTSGIVDYSVPPGRCPYCDAKLDRAGRLERDRGPQPGDLSVCIHCAQPMQFDQQLRLTKISDAHLKIIMKEDPMFARELREYQRRVRALDRRSLKP